MRSRIAPLLVVLACIAAACGSVEVDRLATDACEVLLAHQTGEVTVEQVVAEFEGIVTRAAEAGVSVDLLETQIEVQCFDALQGYLEAAGR